MIALARLAALRQQAAIAQTGFAALSASAALSLGQHSLLHPHDSSHAQLVDNLGRYQPQQSFLSTSPPRQPQPLTPASSQPSQTHGYVASAQPELVEEEEQVFLWHHVLHSVHIAAGLLSLKELIRSVMSARESAAESISCL